MHGTSQYWQNLVQMCDWKSTNRHGPCYEKWREGEIKEDNILYQGIVQDFGNAALHLLRKSQMN